MRLRSGGKRCSKGAGSNEDRNLMKAWFLAAVAALVAAPAAAETVLITADRMLDVLTGRMVEKPAILVEDGRISRIGTQATLGMLEGKRIDLPGLTLVPGFIDMHVHLTGDPLAGVEPLLGAKAVVKGGVLVTDRR